MRNLESVYPYYSREYALAVQNAIDKVIANDRPILRTYAQLGNIKRNTLYAQINQGKRYLLDKLDPQLVYAKLLGGPTKRISFRFDDRAMLIDITPLPTEVLDEAQIIKEMRKTRERIKQINPMWRIDFVEALEAVSSGSAQELIVTSYVPNKENEEYLQSMCASVCEFAVTDDGLKLWRKGAPS